MTGVAGVLRYRWHAVFTESHLDKRQFPDKGLLIEDFDHLQKMARGYLAVDDLELVEVCGQGFGDDLFEHGDRQAPDLVSREDERLYLLHTDETLVDLGSLGVEQVVVVEQNLGEGLGLQLEVRHLTSRPRLIALHTPAVRRYPTSDSILADIFVKAGRASSSSWLHFQK